MQTEFSLPLFNHQVMTTIKVARLEFESSKYNLKIALVRIIDFNSCDQLLINSSFIELSVDQQKVIQFK